jgi:methionyl-tRNA formyltransferase
MGYQTWGHRVLDALIKSSHEVPLVITHPDSDHVYEKIWDDSVAALAAAHDIPTVVRKYANDQEIVERLRDIEPDILVSSDWRTWVAPRIYRTAKHGAVNIHDALLPKYGGFAPLNWAMINGEPEVGVTVHLMNEDFDLGDIVVQRAVRVDPKDTIIDVFHKTVELFAPLTLQALDLIESGTGTRTPQNPADATFFHKRSVEDSRIEWSWRAESISNLVRAQVDPYPNAFAFDKGKRVEILAASITPGRFSGTPGRIFRPQGDGVVIVCGPNARTGEEHGLNVEKIRTEDGSVLSGREYFKIMGGYLTPHPCR